MAEEANNWRPIDELPTSDDRIKHPLMLWSDKEITTFNNRYPSGGYYRYVHYIDQVTKGAFISLGAKFFREVPMPPDIS